MYDDHFHFDMSVIIPCYNGEAYVGGAIESILNQNVRPKQIIVVNDGSTDGSSNVLKGYGEKIHVVNKDNAGLAAARNSGIEHATGEWLAFLDADDRYDVEMVATMMEATQTCSTVGAWFADFWHVSPSGEKIVLGSEKHVLGLSRVQWQECKGSFRAAEGSVLESIVESFWTCSSAFMVRRDLALAIGGYDKNCLRCEDLEFFLRLYKSGAKFGYVSKPLSCVTQHPQSLCRGPSARKKIAENAIQVLSSFRSLNSLSGSESSTISRAVGEHLLSLSWIFQNEGDHAAARRYSKLAFGEGMRWRALRAFARNMIPYSPRKVR